ncbi:hypothetical protein MSTE_00982 [Mycobacteroides stephanolepidis]|uniref:Uncharacterized protein n=1 Tax=[Mycobacterium] stephanolepidis TaxID=1520670 RepID=A0A1Z4ETN8_9MYCO|nr:hypothetical protein [[Mycobacterium] stephanolepidis]BAX96317.1 hypothetical protein MSTE_00982 [[Mycobacterium] stephanolepidis]
MRVNVKERPLKERVLDQIPRYRELQNRRDRLRSLLRIVPPASDLNLAYAEQITAAADTGADNLDDLRDRFAADRQNWTAAAEFNTLVRDAWYHASSETENAQKASVPIALDYLRGELTALMNEVREHREVLQAHPDSAEEAIGAGPAGLKSWKTVNTLIDRYQELRTEHRVYVNLRFGGTVKGFDTCAQSARFLEMDPWWRRCRSTGGTCNDTRIAAWLHNREHHAEGNRTNIWPHSYTQPQWLLAVADNDPWLPDANTIDRANQIATELLGRMPSNNSEITSFYRRIAELTALGAVVDLTTPDTAPATTAHAH